MLDRDLLEQMIRVMHPNTLRGGTVSQNCGECRSWRDGRCVHPKSDVTFCEYFQVCDFFAAPDTGGRPEY